ESTVPVIETGAGNCHAFIDASAKQKMAEEIVLNAKLQSPSICNAIESLLIHKEWFEQYGIELLDKLHEQDVKIIADEQITKAFTKATLATKDDWAKEYLDLTMSVKLVSNTAEAIEHINTYGTHHSETIITEDEKSKQAFLQTVDASSVYHNASTRFTDGFEFGYGAEISIITRNLHAIGSICLQTLTFPKFIVQGTGQVRE